MDRGTPRAAPSPHRGKSLEKRRADAVQTWGRAAGVASAATRAGPVPSEDGTRSPVPPGGTEHLHVRPARCRCQGQQVSELPADPTAPSGRPGDGPHTAPGVREPERCSRLALRAGPPSSDLRWEASALRRDPNACGRPGRPHVDRRCPHQPGPRPASIHTVLRPLEASARLCCYLIKHIGHVLLAAGLLGVAELGGVLAGQQALVPDQRHALVGHLVALEVHLVVGAACEREAAVSAGDAGPRRPATEGAGAGPQAGGGAGAPPVETMAGLESTVERPVWLPRSGASGTAQGSAFTAHPAPSRPLSVPTRDTPGGPGREDKAESRRGGTRGQRRDPGRGRSWPAPNTPAGQCQGLAHADSAGTRGFSRRRGLARHRLGSVSPPGTVS